MQALKGILSLQDAMTAQYKTVPSLNPALLQLGALEKMVKPNEHTSPRYQQSLLYGGASMTLQTPAVTLPELNYHQEWKNCDALLIPLTSWLRQQLTILNDFVRVNVQLPWEFQDSNVPIESLFKPAYDGKSIFIMMSYKCSTSVKVNGVLCQGAPTLRRPQFGYGRYSFSIDIPSVYIAQHKNGQAYSITMRITHIHFEAESPPHIVMSPPWVNGRGLGPLSSTGEVTGEPTDKPTGKPMAGILPTSQLFPAPPSAAAAVCESTTPISIVREKRPKGYDTVY